MSKWIFVLAMMLSVQGVAFPWICPGKTCFSVSGSYYESDRFWDERGKKCDAYQSLKKRSLRFCLGQELNADFAIYAKGGYAWIDEDLDGRTIGLEDFELSLTYRLCTDVHVIATAIIPPEDRYKAALRYGRFGGEGGILFRHQLCVPVTLDLYGGYRFYSGFPSDQVRLASIASFCPLRFLTFWGGFSCEYGLWNGKERIDQSHFFYNPNYRLLRGEIACDLQVLSFGVVRAHYQRHLWGRNVGCGGVFALSWLCNF